MPETDHIARLSPWRWSRPLCAFGLALLLASCGSSPSTPTASTAQASQAAATPSASPTSPAPPSAAQRSSDPIASSSLTTQTDTEWGRIWDTVPAGFPRYPGAQGADDATAQPVSAVYAVSGIAVEDLATWMQSGMESATYSTEALSGPLEDGGYVLDSVGDGDCRIETRITPQGTLIIVTVRYGAACPAP